MEFKSYWQETAPPFLGAVSSAPSGRYDVAVIGAGFTGLGAARKLAAEGRRVIVLEARQVGFGASGRNGGHLNNGLAHGFGDAVARFGAARAASRN